MAAKESEVRRVLEGHLDNLPDLIRTDVRVFFSSTFTDMTIERNHLMKYTVPKLRQHCLMMGLDYQVIDMRWGVRDESSIDHTTTEIVIEEIDKAMFLSKGPYFVSFLGDKYGSRMIPHYIEAKEFKLLRGIAMKLGHDITILDQWFQRDDNADPSVYYLRATTDILTHYDDDSPENSSLKEKEVAEWNKIQDKLLKMLRAAADEAYENRQMSKDARHIYYRSVTEAEINEGVLTSSTVKDRVVNYLRSFNNLNIEDEKAGRFTDLQDGKRDLEAKDLLERLKITKVQPIVGPNEIKKYALNWTPVGIDESNEEHQEYLKDLCHDFYTRMVRMIDESFKQKNNHAKMKLGNKLFQEIHYHVTFAAKKCTIFCGFEDLLDEVRVRLSHSNTDDMQMDSPTDAKSESEKDMTSTMIERHTKETNEHYDSALNHADKIKFKFIHGDLDYDADTDPDRNMKEEAILMPKIQCFSRPVILFGESGTGKTSLMAKIAHKVKEWFPNSVSVIRFLGTTQNSVSIREVIMGICLQIWYLYGIIESVQLDLDSDFQYLLQYFNRLLWKIDTETKPLCIILDSVDQLLHFDNSYDMCWMPQKLPPNVHMIVSILPKVNKCFENTLELMPHTEQYIEVPTMPLSTVDEVINLTLKCKKRRLQKFQRQFICQKFSDCSKPLYLKLLLDEALSWKSHTAISEVNVGDDITKCINIFFDRLERDHGEVFVTRMMAFMCACKDGIGRSELEDLLSLDDDVLQDTYLYHLPPDPESIHIPSSILTRIMSDVHEYLLFRMSGHKIVLSWYHRQFKEACLERYLPVKELKCIHTLMAEYYEGYWYKRPKPLELYKVKKGSYPNADRNVQPQPIKFRDNIYNLRKLLELPYHLIQSQQFEKFRELCGCNFEFLYGKLKTYPIADLLLDLRSALHKMDENSYLDSDNVYSDLDTVSKILMLGQEVIRKDANNLAVQIISRMGPHYNGTPFLKRLVQDALKWCKEVKSPLLLPTMQCSPAPWGMLKFEVSSDVFLKGGDVNRCYGRAAYLCDEEETLYAIQPLSANFANDVLYILDMKDYGSVISVKEIRKSISAVRSIGNNRFIHLQDTQGSECLFEINPWREVKFQYDPDTITVSKTGRLLVYTAVSKIYICQVEKFSEVMKSEMELNAEESPLLHAVISPDELYLVTISRRFVSIWDITLGQLLRQQQDKRPLVPEVNKTVLGGLVFITHGNKLIAPYMGELESQDTSLALTDLTSGDVLCVMKSCEYAMRVLAIHPSQKYAAVGTNDMTVTNCNKVKPWKVWNTESGELVTSAKEKCLFTENGVDTIQLFGNDNLFAAVATHPKSTICISYLGTVDQALPEAVPYCYLGYHCERVIQMIMYADQCCLLSIGADNIIKAWDLQQVPTNFVTEFGQNANAQKVRDFFYKNKMADSYTNQFQISKEENQVYIASSNGEMLVQNLDDNNLVKKLTFDNEGIDHLLTSSGGKYVIAANTGAGQICVIDSTTFEITRKLKHRSSITCMCEANNILVVGKSGMEAEGTVFDIDTGKTIKEFQLLYSLKKLAINSTGTKFVASLFDFPFSVPVEGEGDTMSVDKVDTRMADLTCINISSDDKLALGGSTDGNIRVISMDGDYLFRMLQRSSVTTAVFSPDCKSVVSGGYKSIYVWNLQQGSLTYKLKKHDNFVVNILFDKLGKSMVSSSHDKKIILWNYGTCLSLATYHTACDIDQVEVTSDMSKILFVPEGIDYITTLMANNELQKLMSGKNNYALTSSLLKAQALALSFSSQKIQKQNSSACQIL